MKPAKRLNSKVKNTNLKFSPNRNQRTSPRLAASSDRPEINYQTELANFVALRHPDSEAPTSTLVSTIPSQELIWIRDDSGVKPLAPLPQNPPVHRNIQVDDEIEEGEIVDSEVTGFVNLLQESFAAVKQSQKIVDNAAPSQMFYEDRSTLKSCPIPKYTTFGSDASEPAEDANISDEVICLDSTQSDVDDSVIFVSEEKCNKVGQVKVLPLVLPDCLKSPVVKKLLKLVPSPSPAQAIKSPSKRNTPKRKLRMALWKQKKAVEFAEINAANGKKDEPRPSTSAQLFPPPETATEVSNKELEKRIILIDGSNLAMSFTDNYGAKKIEKDFSAEGERLIIIESKLIFLSIGLKICIDHFEAQGFQVKAIVPEYRLRRDKSSNHDLMNELKDNGKIACTPSKSYDDRVILESAVRLDAAVVSNDHFRKFNM